METRLKIRMRQKGMCLASKDVSTIAIGLPKEEQLGKPCRPATAVIARDYREREWSMLKIERN